MTTMLADHIYQKLMRKRLIFTITTGRSGTGLLASLLARLPRVTALHEPEPRFSDVMRQAQDDPDAATSFMINSKLPMIADMPGDTYVETSHLFCKGFVEPMLKLNVVPDLIILRRHREVAMSLLTLRTIPGRTAKGLQFCLSPDDPGVLALPDWQELDDYQLCFWYCLETQRRAELYTDMLRKSGARTADASLKQISTPQGFEDLAEQMELPASSRWEKFKALVYPARKVNVKRWGKDQTLLPANLEELENALIERLPQSAKHSNLGVDSGDNHECCQEPDTG